MSVAVVDEGAGIESRVIYDDREPQGERFIY